jgi:hypothetical protein
VVTQKYIPQKRQDEQREVTVALADRRLVIDWSEGQQLDIKAEHGRLAFLIGGGALLGAVIESLSQAEQQALLVLMPCATTPDSPPSTPRG